MTFRFVPGSTGQVPDTPYLAAVELPADGIPALTEFDQALTLRQVSTLNNGIVLRRAEDLSFAVLWPGREA